MIRSEIEKKVLKIIEKTLMEKGELPGDKNAREMWDQSEINSIIFIMLIVNMEAEFDIEFDDEYLLKTKIDTIEILTDYLFNKISGN